MNDHKSNLRRDLGVVAISIIIAVILAKTGVLKDLLITTQELRFIGSFLAGLFFVSVFTAAPAMVVLAGIAQTTSIWEVALFGGIGALMGDFLIFRFIENHLSEDIQWLVGKTKREKLSSILHLRFFRWLAPFVGAFMISSPLPDEIGLAIMGLARMKMRIFVPLSFALHFSGILIIGLIAKGFL